MREETDGEIGQQSFREMGCSPSGEADVLMVNVRVFGSFCFSTLHSLLLQVLLAPWVF